LKTGADVLDGELKVGRCGNRYLLSCAQTGDTKKEYPNEINGLSIIHESSSSIYNQNMTISARNKLRGTIEEVQLGTVMAHVVVRMGENLIESAITRRSAEELKLKKGDSVAAVVKATEVMIQKD